MTFNLKYKHRYTADSQAAAKSAGRIRALCMVPIVPFLLLLPGMANANARSANNDALASQQVRIDDLDLQTPDGWRAAKLRVSGAAMRVCARQSNLFSSIRCRAKSAARGEHALALHAGTRQGSITNIREAFIPGKPG